MAQARKKVGWMDAATLGALQGFTFNFGDEAARAIGDESYTEAVRQAQADRPGLFAAGQVFGNVGPWSKLAGVAMQGAKSGLPFISRAAAIDAASGGAYGAGGAQAGEVGLEERLESAGRGAAIGGLTAGLVPLAFRNIDQARMNLPVLQGKPPLHADQSLVFAGGRTADDIVGEALSRDEALMRADGAKNLFGRNGVEATPLDAGGPNVRSLFELANRSERGGAIAKTRSDMSAREAIDARLKALRAWDGETLVRGGDGAPLRPMDPGARPLADDLIAALDDAEAHKAWISYARRELGEDRVTRAALAEEIVDEVRRRTVAAKGEALETLLQRVGPGGDITAKLRALGVQAAKGGEGRKKAVARRAAFSSAEDRLAVREPAARTPKGREEPVDMPRAGLSEDDAAALMTAIYQPRRVNYVRPSRDPGPMLDVQARPGAKWENPFAVDPRLGMAAYYTGKPTAVIVDQEMHGGGLSLLPQDIAELARESDARRKPTARNRWTYAPA